MQNSHFYFAHYQFVLYLFIKKNYNEAVVTTTIIKHSDF